MHGIKDAEPQMLNDMVRESLTIMEKIWAREPFFYEGRFWNAGYPEEKHGDEGDDQHKLADLSPWGGAPEIAVTGFSAKSPSMRFAGERGFLLVRELGLARGAARGARHVVEVELARGGHLLDARERESAARDFTDSERDRYFEEFEKGKWEIRGFPFFSRPSS